MCLAESGVANKQGRGRRNLPFRWLALFAAICLSALPSCQHGRSPITTTPNVFSVLPNQIECYWMDVGTYPTTLDALLTNPGSTRWCGPYVRGGSIPTDPWRNALSYASDADGYELRSAGPDMVMPTSDVVIEGGTFEGGRRPDHLQIEVSKTTRRLKATLVPQVDVLDLALGDLVRFLSEESVHSAPKEWRTEGPIAFRIPASISETIVLNRSELELKNYPVGSFWSLYDAITNLCDNMRLGFRIEGRSVILIPLLDERKGVRRP